MTAKRKEQRGKSKAQLFTFSLFYTIFNTKNFATKYFATKNIGVKMNNPFKFGTIVEEPYFTNRVKEIDEVNSVLKSQNHLIIISPRRYGKTSLINKVLKTSGRPFLILDLQIITSPEDFAAQLLKRLYRIFPAQRIRDMIKNFRILPVITLNPLTNEIDVAFRTPSASAGNALEDVIDLIEKLSSKKKSVIVFDEFQEINRIGKNLDRLLRSVMQHHKSVNYVFLGSQESLIREIFEKKKSPFYHFGHLLPLDKIPEDEFRNYLHKNFTRVMGKNKEKIADTILKITHCHPYYTQQLAFNVWELLNKNENISKPVETAVDGIIKHHDIDYERLWNTMTNTEKKIFIGLSSSENTPLSDEFLNKFNTGPASTTYSGIKKMMQKGYVIRTSEGYEIDDPFFKEWIKLRRNK